MESMESAQEIKSPEGKVGQNEKRQNDVSKKPFVPLLHMPKNESKESIEYHNRLKNKAAEYLSHLEPKATSIHYGPVLDFVENNSHFSLIEGTCTDGKDNWRFQVCVMSNGVVDNRRSYRLLQ